MGSVPKMFDRRSEPIYRSPDIALEGLRPRIPDGVYDAVYLGHDCALFAGAPKVYVKFRIVSEGDVFGTEVFRAYGVRKILSKRKQNGRIKLGPRSELFLTLVRLAEKCHPNRRLRPDQISLRMLEGCILQIRTRTVTQDYKQRPLPQMLAYSVVDQILDVKEGTLYL